MAFIGVDLHTNSFTVCRLHDDGSEVFETLTLSASALQAFCLSLDANDEIAVEATGNTAWFCEEIRPGTAQPDGPTAPVETGPDPEKDGVDRWRRVDLKDVIKARFGIDYHERHVGQKLRGLLKGCGEWTIEIIRRSDTAEGFEVLPRRWVVKRTFAWFAGSRRLARDWEKSTESPAARGYISSIRPMIRHLATCCHVS